MQLSFDAADRLVELVEARHGPVPAEDAARTLYSLRHVPAGLARSLLADVVEGDARLSWRGANVGLADAPGTALALESATYVVVDLETTGLSPGTSSICEIGAVRVRGLELEERFETLVNPRRPLPAAIAALTGIDPRALRGAPPVELAVRRFLEFAGDAVLVAHNARFDIGFLDREVERLTGRRIAAPVVDTVWLARRVLAGRIQRVGLASLAHFFGTSTRPCHRALADAEATAEILLALIGLAQERGASTVAELADLAAPRARRLAGKRSLVAGAPQRPGVYLFRDATSRCSTSDARATFGRDSARTSGPSGSGPPSRRRSARSSGWSGACSAPSSRPALEELRLLRELRPPANARSTRPDRHVYLRRRGAGWCVTEHARPARAARRAARRARLAARALDGWEGEPADGAARAAREAEASRGRSPLRGRCAVARPDRCARPRSRARSPSSNGFVRSSSACSCRRPRTASSERSSSRAGGWRRRGPSSRVPRDASRPRPVSPSPPAPRRRLRRRTWTSCC